MKLPNALGMSREYARKYIKPGDSVVDATAGRGRDTLLLSGLVGERGKVWSFDIQEEAIVSTKTLLINEGKYDNVMLINDSHEGMDEYIDEEISCAVFNLGYLPGGDHSIHTKSKTSINAIKKALELMKKEGIVLMVVYHGGHTGFKERDDILEFCSELDQHRFTTAVTRFINQGGNPPIFICIQKT